MAVIADIADAVKDELNGHEIRQVFDATRVYVPVFDLPDMKTLHVTVVPKAMAVQRASRSQNQHDYQIDVAVQKKLTAADDAEIDPLMTLVEEIAEFLAGQRLATYQTAVCVDVANEPIYSPEHMEQLRQFTSVLTLTYRVLR